MSINPTGKLIFKTAAQYKTAKYKVQSTKYKAAKEVLTSMGATIPARSPNMKPIEKKFTWWRKQSKKIQF